METNILISYSYFICICKQYTNRESYDCLFIILLNYYVRFILLTITINSITAKNNDDILMTYTLITYSNDKFKIMLILYH